MSTYTI